MKCLMEYLAIMLCVFFAALLLVSLCMAADRNISSKYHWKITVGIETHYCNSYVMSGSFLVIDDCRYGHDTTIHYPANITITSMWEE